MLSFPSSEFPTREMHTSAWKTTATAALKITIPLSSPHLARFHSTPISPAKWKSKWDCKDERSAKNPSKTYIRYAVRQKRADAKKALKNFLLYGKSSKLYFQDEDLGPPADIFSSRKAKVGNSSHVFHDHPSQKNSGNSKPHSSPFSGKGKPGGNKSWKNKQRFYYEDDCKPAETFYQATFCGHRGFTWTFSSWDNVHFNNLNTGFEWRHESNWDGTQKRVWSESDVEDEPTDVGLRSHRVTLGMPPTGPLKLDDVKYAFRLSALKWHPDKHQGPSQAMAEEKFKLCVDAYNSLCTALRSG